MLIYKLLLLIKRRKKMAVYAGYSDPIRFFDCVNGNKCDQFLFLDGFSDKFFGHERVNPLGYISDARSRSVTSDPRNHTKIWTACKIVLYLFVIPPLIALIGKCYDRCIKGTTYHKPIQVLPGTLYEESLLPSFRHRPNHYQREVLLGNF